MRENSGNLWTHKADWRVITTNGFVKKNGEAVMGAGVAKQARSRFPDLPTRLGNFIKTSGNHVGIFEDIGILTMPVKHNWWESADLRLIERSCLELASLPYSGTIAVPKPGCGNGKLLWKDVKEVIQPLLDDRFVVLV
jgi:hypothetical protein